MHRVMCALTAASFLLAQAAGAQAQTVAVDGTRFTVDGAPKFLLFISYFDAMRRGPNAADIDDDLQFIKRQGFDGIRIFPNWMNYSCRGGTTATDTLFTSGTSVQAGRWPAFQRVLERAGAAGLIVDVTFTRDTVQGLTSVSNYRDQIVAVAAALAGGYRHVFFDIQNEFTKSASQQHLSPSDVRSIVAGIKQKDPQRLVTASTQGGEFAEAGLVAAAADLDFATPHLNGVPGWATGATITAAMQAARTAMGARSRPVHFGEVGAFASTIDDGCAPQEGDAGEYVAAVKSAKSGGAAGWTFHTRRTFNLTHSYKSKLVDPNGTCRPGVTECAVISRLAQGIAESDR